MYQVYGIKNCSTVKKALDQLTQKDISYQFIDFKKSPPTKDLISTWKKDFGDWPVNKKGRTYQQMKEEFENGTDSEKFQLLIEKSSMIKRPIVMKKDKVLCFGLDQQVIEQL